MSYFWDWAWVFLYWAVGVLPQEKSKNFGNGNPDSGAPGCSMKVKEAKQRGKNGRKSIFQGFSFFESLLYLKYKIIIFEFPILFFLSCFCPFLLDFLVCNFSSHAPLEFYSSGAIKVWKSFSVAKGQMQPGFSGWMHLKNGYSLHSSLSSPFWTQKTLLFDCLPHLLLPNKYKKGFPIQTEMGRHPHGHQILPLPHSVALTETPCE